MALGQHEGSVGMAMATRMAMVVAVGVATVLVTVVVPQCSQGSSAVSVAQLPPLLLPGGHELVRLGDAVEP